MTLRASDLSLSRGGRCVVEAVSTVLEPGTITAICGPNGAGKSSLLLALAGLLSPTEGEVTLDGADLTCLPPRKRARRIGYLPQEADVAWDVAVESLVALGRLPHRDNGQTAIAAAISALGLEPLRHRPVSQLSGGERARALLGRVLAGEPQWILADEPLAALDLGHQLALIAHLKTCAQAGQGVVMVVHDLAVAMNHADRVLVLNHGRLIADALPSEALSPKVIADVWQVDGQWLGEARGRALITR